MTDEHSFPMRYLKSGNTYNGMFHIVSSKYAHIMFNFIDQEGVRYEAEMGCDHYDALRKLRLVLEKYDILLLCKGASKHFRLSGMSREMSHGVSGYDFEVEVPKGGLPNLARIYDPAKPGEVMTVQKQDEHLLEWYRHIKKA